MTRPVAGKIESYSHLSAVLAQLNRHRHFEGFDDTDLFRVMSPEAALIAAPMIPKTYGQLRQDLFVAAALGFKRDGYFVEFGATDGVYLSNTLLLEAELGWRGVLAEPARAWRDTLATNRSVDVDFRCVYSESGKQMLFRGVESDQALSTLVEYADSDLHSLSRRHGDDYLVETVSLKDLLDEHSAPKDIDYISLDTEGSEYDVLLGFDFSAYNVKIITCEHNYTEHRNLILDVLKGNGFIRVLNDLSLFDDWYVHSAWVEELSIHFPGWEKVSHQNTTLPQDAPSSDKDRMLAKLQGTVLNLIDERDAYQKGLEDHETRLKSDNTVEILNETIANISKERDAYKNAMKAHLSGADQNAATIKNLISERDAYKKSLSEHILAVEKDKSVSILQDTIQNLTIERDAYENAMKTHLSGADQNAATIKNLISERDAYKKSLSEHILAVEKDKSVSILQDTIQNLTIERDAYKESMIVHIEGSKLNADTIKNLIIERDAYKKSMSDHLRNSNNDDTIAMLTETVRNLIIDRDAYKNSLMEHLERLQYSDP